MPPLPGVLRALLLDLDGTVADSHGLIVQCYQHAILKHLGRKPDVEIWRRQVGLPLDTILAATFEHFDMPCSGAQMEEIKLSYREHMRAHLDSVKPFSGMRETLLQLRQRGLRLAIVTTKHRAMAMRHLETLHLDSLFEALVAGDMVERCKPDPEPFLRAIAMLNVAPGEVCAIGDSPYDILGAHAAGIYAVAACWGSDCREDLLAAGPDRTAEAPADLLALLA